MPATQDRPGGTADLDSTGYAPRATPSASSPAPPCNGYAKPSPWSSLTDPKLTPTTAHAKDRSRQGPLTPRTAHAKDRSRQGPPTPTGAARNVQASVAAARVIWSRVTAIDGAGWLTRAPETRTPAR